jgi:hypothetical protein
MPEGVGSLTLVGPQRPPALVEADSVRLSVDIAGQILRGQPSLSSTCLRCPRSDGWTTTVSSSIRLPTRPLILALRSTSVSTARSVLIKINPCVGCFSIRSRP